MLWLDKLAVHGVHDIEDTKVVQLALYDALNVKNQALSAVL